MTVANPAATTRQLEPADLVRTAAAGIIATLVIAALYFGQPMFVPFALAVLLAFALAPAAEFLRRIGIPRVLAVILSVLTAVVVIAMLSTFIGVQLGKLARDIPGYQSNLTAKIASVRGAATGNDIVESASSLFANLNKAIAGKPQSVPPSSSALTSSSMQRVQRPIPVEVRQPDLAPFQVVESIVDPLLGPLAILAIAIVFVIFILLHKEDLRSRFISLVGSRDLQRTSIAIDDGAQRLSRYLLLQTLVNGCVGLILGLGLWWIGVPNPALWGLIAAIFRFVPYVGVPTAAIIPIALALAVDPGWMMVALTAALYLVTEGITGQAIEPWLYGRNMGLSPIAVLLAAAFWTLIWGPIGLLLSTPLTMCVVVLGRHVESLRFLDTLLGDQPALGEEEDFYLGLLKGDPDALAQRAEEHLKENPLSHYFDLVVVRGLALAQADIARGALTGERRKNILSTVSELVENLAESGEMELESAKAGDESVSADWNEKVVLCVAGREPLDQAAAILLSDLLRRRGIKTRIISPDEVSQAQIYKIEPEGVGAICLSYLESENPANARFLVRRLRKQLPDIPIIAGFWRVVQDDTQFLDWIEAIGSDYVVSELGKASDSIAGLALRPQVVSPSVESAPPSLSSVSALPSA
ncbi:MAG TPA: AI-2E family transporter [Rhizomicrobium sp.]